MRYLGLDYGTKTVGLAVSDRTGFLASNYGVIRYSDTSEIFKELERIIKDEKIEAFVLGYPKNMNNTCGKRVEETLILKEELEKKFNLPVFLMDERLSTTEAEKGVEPEEANQETTLPPVVEEKAPEVKDAIADDVQIMETEVKETEIKRPEIIPGEEILPDVDIPLVISNLTNADYDVQAQQMEEIARISLDNPENAVPYIVREVFSSLIDITKKDTANLAAPTDEQVQARKKLISNFIVMENAKQGQGQVKLPYQLTEKDFALANELSPMEQAERNKEYALYTISILAKIYTDEVEKQTGNIVPLTDLPGSAAIVDALRFNPNSGVKIAAIDALRHIQRPEYKEELTTLYTLAQADSNPQVSMAAERALNRSNV